MRHERSPTLAAPRRYYPGFFGALFLILLRTAIGWHLLTEGVEKLKAPVEKPFTAEYYLRGSTGPLAPWFRSQVPDVFGLERLSRDSSGRPATLKAQWREELDRYATHYNFSSEQLEQAEQALEATSNQADAWFNDPANVQAVDKYRADVDRLNAIEQSPRTLRHEREKMYEDRSALEADRRDLLAPVVGWTNSLRLSWQDVLTVEQRQRVGEPPAPPRTTLDWINLTTAWGLTIAGIGLLLGLLTPIAALMGAALLCMFYLSMPPWPGLPEPPNAEGHYWIVNKNLVEMLACLVLASTPNGLWIGLDALLFGWIGRRRGTASTSGVSVVADPPGSNPAPVKNGPDRPRGPVPIETHPTGSKSIPASRSER